MNHSIRFRLTLATVVSVGVFGVMLGVAARTWVERDLRAGLRTFARHEAHEVLSTLGPAKTREDVFARREALDRLYPEEGVASIDIWSPAGVHVLGYPDAASTQRAWPEGIRRALRGEEPWQEIELQGSPAAIRTAVVVPGQVHWVVVTAVRTDRVMESVDRFTQAYLLGLLGFGFLSALGAYVLVGRALQPVLQLVQTAERLAEQRDALGRLDPPAEGSELAELVGLINGLLSTAEATVERLRRFTAHAGHELRTPLSRMRGEVEQALRSGSEGETVSALHGVLEEVDTLRGVLDALLELAHSAEPLEESRKAPVDLSSLVDEIVEGARHLPERGERELVVEADPEVWVQAHRPLIARALWNLVHNAISYSHPEREILVRVTQEDDQVACLVENVPCRGLPPLTEDLFEPFARAKQTGEVREGHGLGLPLSRAIAFRHRGRLEGGSHPDGRVWVRLTLPRAKPARVEVSV